MMLLKTTKPFNLPDSKNSRYALVCCPLINNYTKAREEISGRENSVGKPMMGLEGMRRELYDPQ